MQEAKVKVIKFESEDVIATSLDPNLYYFYGIGNDVLAPNGNGLYIFHNGEDVTDQYGKGYSYFGDYAFNGGYIIENVEKTEGGMTAAQLAEAGFVDGPYQLSTDENVKVASGTYADAHQFYKQ